MVCKEWNAIAEELYPKLYTRAFGGTKLPAQSWSGVFSSFPVLLDILCQNLPAAPRTYLTNLVHKTPWFFDLVNNKVQLAPAMYAKNCNLTSLQGQIFEWAIGHGFHDIVWSLDTTLAGQLQKRMSESTSAFSPKPPLLVCVTNKLIEFALTLVQKAPPKFAPGGDVYSDLGSALVGSCVDRQLMLDFLKCLPGPATVATLSNAIRLGDLDLIKGIDASHPNLGHSFEFSAAETLQLFQLCLKEDSLQKRHKDQNYQQEIEQTLKTIHLGSKAKGGATVDFAARFSKNRLEILAWLVKNNFTKNLAYNQVIPCVGTYETYQVFVDAFAEVPAEIVFGLCSSANTKIDILLLDYLLTSKKVSKSIVNKLENGLVYNAFLTGDLNALKVFIKHQVPATIFAAQHDTTLFDLAAYSPKFADGGPGPKLKLEPLVEALLRFPDVVLPNPELLFVLEPSIVTRLVARGVSVNPDTTPTLLQKAIQRKISDAIIKILLDNGANFNVAQNGKGPDYMTPLALAVYQERDSLVDELLKKGASARAAINSLKESLPKAEADESVEFLMAVAPPESLIEKEDPATAAPAITLTNTNKGGAWHSSAGFSFDAQSDQGFNFG